jgi:hypothetical protein
MIPVLKYPAPLPFGRSPEGAGAEIAQAWSVTCGDCYKLIDVAVWYGMLPGEKSGDFLVTDIKPEWTHRGGELWATVLPTKVKCPHCGAVGPIEANEAWDAFKLHAAEKPIAP